MNLGHDMDSRLVAHTEGVCEPPQHHESLDTTPEAQLSSALPPSQANSSGDSMSRPVTRQLASTKPRSRIELSLPSDWSKPRLPDVSEFRESLLSQAKLMARNVGPTGGVSDENFHSSVDPPDLVLKSLLLNVKSRRQSIDPTSVNLQTSTQSNDDGIREVSRPKKLAEKEPIQAIESVDRSFRMRRRRRSRNRSVSPPRDVMRKAMRMAERIAARKIQNLWRKRIPAATEPVQIRAPSDPSSQELHSRQLLKQMVTSALANSRTIRDELMAIRSEVARGYAEQRVFPAPSVNASVIVPAVNHKIPQMVTSEPVHLEANRLILVDKPDTSNGTDEGGGLAMAVTSVPVACNIWSARVLLNSNVGSPLAIQKFLNEILGQDGKEILRLAIGQPTLHPKAFVLVVCRPKLSKEEWIAKLLRSSSVDCIDQSFILDLSTRHSLPWEVRIRSEMIAITPNWNQKSIL